MLYHFLLDAMTTSNRPRKSELLRATEVSNHRVQRLQWGHGYSKVRAEEALPHPREHHDDLQPQGHRRRRRAARSAAARGYPEHPIGEQIFFGSEVSLQSWRGESLFLLAPSESSRTARFTCAAAVRGATRAVFTLVNLDDSGSNGVVCFGHRVWLKLSIAEVVGAQVVVEDTAVETKGKDRIGRRVGRPVVLPDDRSAQFTAQWKTLVDPGAPFETRSSLAGREVGHLASVCLEQDWFYLADDAGTGPTLRQGAFSADGVSGARVEASSAWRIHLRSHSKTRASSVPRAEQILSRAQKQLTDSEEGRGARGFARSIRADMRTFSRRSDDRYLAGHTAGEAPARQLRASRSAGLLRRPSTAAAEARLRDGAARDGKQQRAKAATAAPTALRPGTAPHRASSRPPKALVRARAKALAMAAEAQVKAEVWMELRAQEAKLKQEKSAAWNGAAVSLQRAFKRWHRNRWQRELCVLDASCKGDVENEERAAAATSLLRQHTSAATTRQPFRGLPGDRAREPSKPLRAEAASPQRAVAPDSALTTQQQFTLLQFYNPEVFSAPLALQRPDGGDGESGSSPHGEPVQGPPSATRLGKRAQSAGALRRAENANSRGSLGSRGTLGLCRPSSAVPTMLRRKLLLPDKPPRGRKNRRVRGMARPQSAGAASALVVGRNSTLRSSASTRGRPQTAGGLRAGVTSTRASGRGVKGARALAEGRVVSSRRLLPLSR